MAIIDKSNNEKILLKIAQASIYGQASAELKNLLTQKVKEHSQDIHLDLSQVKYIDSASIGTLLYFIQILKKSDNKIYIEGITDELRELFSALMIEQFLVINTPTT